MTPPHLRPYDSVLETIGWTPLIRLGRIGAGLRTPIYGKAEYANPGGSVKDRIGLAIIEDAERRGELRAGGTIVEGTSGNTGVGLAIAACIKGYRCIFTMPDKMSMEKVRLLKAYGAEVVVTPTAVPPDHPDHYVMKAKQIVHDTPGAILANQFYNQINPETHYATMGPEIWQQTEGRVTHFVAGAGTGGTVSGAGKYLKEKNPRIRVIAGDPVGSLYTHYHRTRTMGDGHPYKVEGIGGDKIPTTVWFDWIDEFRQASDKTSFTMARRLAREEGLLLGGSAGLNVALARGLGPRAGRPRRAGRHHSVRHRGALPLEAVQRRLDAGKPDARHSADHGAGAAPAPAGERPRGGERGPGGGGAPGAHPHEHLGGEPDPGARERPIRRRPDRGHADDAGARAAGAAGPAGQRGDGSAVPRGRGHHGDRSRGRDAHPGESGGAGSKDGKLIGIVSRYDVLQQLIGIAVAGRRSGSPVTFPDAFMRVTVLTGGTSAERDVAIASAVQIIAALRSRGHDVAVVDTARGYIPQIDEPSLLSGSVGTEPPSIDQLHGLEQGLLLSGLGNLAVVRDAEVLFLALHGGRGEDGTLQTLLEMVGVPYTGSGRLGSAMAMDKDVSKRLFRIAGVPTADWVMAPADAARVGRDFGWPVVVKPSKQGSTVGLTVVKASEGYERCGRAGPAVRRRGHDRAIRARPGAHGRGAGRQGPGRGRDHSAARDFRLRV